MENELEEQFILRLPSKQAKTVRKALLKGKKKKFKNVLSISLDNDKEIRTGEVRVKTETLQAKMVNLPCVIDSNTTTDKTYIFKTANISQMLVCEKTPTEGSSSQHPHGLAPPLKNVRKQRFRKVLHNKENIEEVVELERELLLLLRADSEACSTRFEIRYEDQPPIVNERVLFGEPISDSGGSSESSEEVDNVQ
ncbi:hypothetical protein PPYR_03564 [Photinus pyralis]|uniref:TAFII55 protein conserved region domain-containing protein n=1 Tax=Photinus pyralis TaxID=7054 RepID=A0A5N4A349_PHOPY|nr:transcription initiation factor TFIID subunit 7-like [Photinus pyralis]KAB0791764.1 hypothetical protein PPYR_03564 [Photinus pyralis]